MARNVFRAAEVDYQRQYFNLKGSDVVLPLDVALEPQPLEPQLVEPLQPDPMAQHNGPSVDDLQREAERLEARMEEKRREMYANAEREAEEIVARARSEAGELVKKAHEEARVVRESAEENVEGLLVNVKKQGEEIITAAEEHAADQEVAAAAKGVEEGRTRGYQDGRAEMERLIGRLHTIIAKILARRREILNSAEQQVVQLVLLVARKVVKVVSAEYDGVVRHNIAAALRKLRTNADIVIRVNTEDLELTTQNKKEFIALAEKVGNITIAEDSSIARGGCIIETDIGEIDARIDSQLRAIEDRIMDQIPSHA